MLNRPRWKHGIRRLGLEHNPLRRTVDRVETAVRLGLVAAFVFIAPPVAVGVAHHAKALRLHAENTQTVRHRVIATLLRDAPPPVGRFGVSVTKALVEARWNAPDGSPRTGVVHASWGHKANSTATIWVDDSGRQVDPPLRRSQLVREEFVAAALTLAVLAFGALIVAHVVQQVLDRRRMARWDAAWSAAEPLWTGRRRHH